MILDKARALIAGVSPTATSLTIEIDSAYVRAFSFDIPPGLTSLRDMSSLARLRFNKLYGEHDTTWHVVPNFSLGPIVPAFAIKQELYLGLQDIARSIKAKLISVVPTFTVAVRQFTMLSSGSNCWVASFGGPRATLMVLNANYPSVQQEFLSPEYDSRATLKEVVVPRASLSTNLIHDAPPQLIAEDDLPNGRRTPVRQGLTRLLALFSLDASRRLAAQALRQFARFDFLQTEVPRAKHRSVACGLALVCVLPAMWAAHIVVANNIAADKVLAKERTLETRISSLQGVGMTRAPALSARQVGSINKAIASLNLPWDGLLHGVALAAKGDVAILALHPAASTSELSGVAEAANAGNMLDFINKLRLQPPFSDAYLTAHEVVEQDPAKPLRFEFRAKWSNG